MLNIVLFQPEIPPNTGNIIRTCVALNAKLHIIKPISFDLDPVHMARSGAGRLLSDIQHEVHANYEEFYKKYSSIDVFYITRYGDKTYSDIDYVLESKKNPNNDVWLMFGRESTGIDKNILFKHLEHCLRIPMFETMRSINLANCVAILGYEVARQFDFKNLSKFEVQKGRDYLVSKKWTNE